MINKTEDRIRLTVPVGDVRLDAFLSQNTSLSRSRSQELIECGFVDVNGVTATQKKQILKAGDTVVVKIPEDREIEAVPQDIPLDIVYEDDDLIVVNKPQGMVVHPAPGNPDGTMVNALLHHCGSSLSGINGVLRPGIVHRIDKDTSGLLVAAKSDRAHTFLAELIKKHDFTRQYYAILYGTLTSDTGEVRTAIGRSTKDRKKMANYPVGSPNAKDAVTHYQVLERANGYTLVRLTLETGRTHQIRVHMQSLGHPVLDDPLYAADRKKVSNGGQCLHAAILGFRHPVTGEELLFSAPPPSSFISILRQLGFSYEF